MKILAAAILALILATACAPQPALAQSTSAPLLSLQRVSLGFRGEYVAYSPAHSLGLDNSGEFKIGVPIAYNLGKYSSLGLGFRYGLTSKIKEYSAGVTLHLLAHGKTP